MYNADYWYIIQTYLPFLLTNQINWVKAKPIKTVSQDPGLLNNNMGFFSDLCSHEEQRIEICQQMCLIR